MPNKHCNICCYRSVMKDILLGEQSTFLVEYRLPLKGFSWNVLPRPFHACATHAVCLVSSAVKEEDFNCKTKFLISRILAAIEDIFLKLRTPYIFCSFVQSFLSILVFVIFIKFSYLFHFCLFFHVQFCLFFRSFISIFILDLIN